MPTFRPLAGILVCVLLAIDTQPARGAEIVRDPKLNITFMLPEGFTPVPAEWKQPEFPYAFARDAGQPEQMILIRIRGCGARVAEDELSVEDMMSLREQHPGTERFTEQWRTFHFDGVKAITTDPDGVKRVHYGLPLSLEPEAILVIVSGPATRDSEVRELLQFVLRNFEGTPSLPQSTEGRGAPRRGFVLKNKHLVLAGLTLVGVLFLGWVFVRRKKWARPPT